MLLLLYSTALRQGSNFDLVFQCKKGYASLVKSEYLTIHIPNNTTTKECNECDASVARNEFSTLYIQNKHKKTGFHPTYIF